MKKITSFLVLSALLLATFAVSASAASYFDYGNLQARINVKKSASVKIDGVISEGEYEEYTDGYTEWYVAENASEYFDDAEKMAESARWYFSWDGKNINIAAQWDAGRGGEQEYPGGDYYGDYEYVDSDEFIQADCFLGYGTGVNVVSNEASPDDDQWARFVVSVSENTASGEKITGIYSSQNGQNMDYFPSHDDFDFTYNGTVVTVEYRIPVFELCETFKENVGGQMFKASITLTAGIATGAEDEAEPASYSYGVRLGQLGYASDSGNIEKVHATFRLLDESVTNITPPDETPDETPDKTPEVTPDETPDKTPEVTPDETPDKTPEVTPDNTPDTNPEYTPEETPDAPQTGDLIVIVSAAVAVSVCGIMLVKKKK